VGGREDLCLTLEYVVRAGTIALTEVIPMCYTNYLKYIVSIENIYLFLSNYTYSDMFRLEGVIIRLLVEQYRRYIKYSVHFGIPKSLPLKIQVKLLQYCCLNVLYILFELVDN